MIRTILPHFGLIGLLFVAFISSIIPIPTEPIVFGLLRARENPEMVLTILIIGSIIGSSLGFVFGKYGLRNIVPFHNKEREKKTQMYFQKYGILFLLISPWIPFIGDLAPMVAGIENYKLKKFLIVISIAKIIKNIGVVYLSIRVIHWWTLFTK
jgi:membrane protein YqaA with SNARE-associated domain